MTPNESAAIRKLSSGESQNGVLNQSEGNRLRVTLDKSPGSPELKLADLVEITSVDTVYLGEVLYRKGNVLTVGVEHLIDRAALAAIQQVWYRPESE